MAVPANSIAMTLDIDGTTITCLLDVSISETVDVFDSACAGNTVKQKTVGQSDVNMTVTFNRDDSDVTEENALRPGTAYTALTFNPFGAGTGLVTITSTSGFISDVTGDYSTTANASGTRVIQMNNITYALQP